MGEVQKLWADGIGDEVVLATDYATLEAKYSELREAAIKLEQANAGIAQLNGSMRSELAKLRAELERRAVDYVCFWRKIDGYRFDLECGGGWSREDTRDGVPAFCGNCGKETELLSPFHDGVTWQKAPTFEEGRAAWEKKHANPSAPKADDPVKVQMLEALVKAEEDINWMINSGQLLNRFVFNYVDEAIAAARKGEGE